MIPKPIVDAGYTAVGLGVLALQQFHAHRRAVHAHVERVAAPVCSVVSGGREVIGSLLGRGRISRP